MSGAVLKRLEFADQLPELLPLLEIVDGHRRSAGGDADQFGSSTSSACIQGPRQRRPPIVDLADYRVSVELDIVELDSRRLGTVGQSHVVDFRCSLRDSEQRQAIAVAWRTGGSRNR